MDDHAAADEGKLQPPSGGAPARPHEHRRWYADIRAEYLATQVGVVVAPAQPEHLLEIHLGASVQLTSRCDGRDLRRTQDDGDIDIVPAGLPSVWEEREARAILALRLAPARLRTAASDLGLNADRVDLVPQFQIRDAQIVHIGRALVTEAEAGYPGGHLVAESLGAALALHLVRCHSPRNHPFLDARRGLSSRQLRRVKDYIEGNLDQSLSLTGLADVTGLSVTQFKILFKLSTGLPVHQYVMWRRVERAKHLLLEGNLPMVEVALEAGFAHQSHMARWMRRVLGMTPSDVARCRR